MFPTAPWIFLVAKEKRTPTDRDHVSGSRTVEEESEGKDDCLDLDLFGDFSLASHGRKTVLGLRSRFARPPDAVI